MADGLKKALDWLFGAPGIVVALPCAFLLKRFRGQPADDTQRHRDLAFSGTVYEIALVVMSAYMAYLTAEVHSHASSFASVSCLEDSNRKVAKSAALIP